jgi:hypothetical protein
MNKLGPIEYAILEFPGTNIGSEMLPPLRDLVQKKIIRIIDLIVVIKDADGNVRSAELGEMSPDQASVFEGLEPEVLDLFNAEDIELAAEGMAPNTAAAMLVWENVWASDFMNALRSVGGRVATNDRIPAQIIEEALSASAAVKAA